MMKLMTKIGIVQIMKLMKKKKQSEMLMVNVKMFSSVLLLLNLLFLFLEECPSFRNSSKLLSKEELIGLFKTIHGNGKRLSDKFVTVGLVGYPNVGKSSTINTLLENKKVSVSSTPGKTKHFQVYSIKYF